MDTAKCLFFMAIGLCFGACFFGTLLRPLQVQLGRGLSLSGCMCVYAFNNKSCTAILAPHGVFPLAY